MPPRIKKDTKAQIDILRLIMADDNAALNRRKSSPGLLNTTRLRGYWQWDMTRKTGRRLTAAGETLLSPHRENLGG